MLTGSRWGYWFHPEPKTTTSGCYNNNNTLLDFYFSKYFSLKFSKSFVALITNHICGGRCLKWRVAHRGERVSLPKFRPEIDEETRCAISTPNPESKFNSVSPTRAGIRFWNRKTSHHRYSCHLRLVRHQLRKSRGLLTFRAKIPNNAIHVPFVLSTSRRAYTT
jgi:hypothetical protein